MENHNKTHILIHYHEISPSQILIPSIMLFDLDVFRIIFRTEYVKCIFWMIEIRLLTAYEFSMQLMNFQCRKIHELQISDQKYFIMGKLLSCNSSTKKVKIVDSFQQINFVHDFTKIISRKRLLDFEFIFMDNLS